MALLGYRCYFVGGMRDVLVCLDAKTSKERWRVDFVEEFKAPLPDYSHKVSEEETWGHLAACGDQLFVRELKGISAYRWQ